jgi:hypothetical protein
MNRQSGGIGTAALILVLTLAVVAASAAVLVQTAQGQLSTEAFTAALEQCGTCFAVLLGGPMLLGLVGALVAGTGGGRPEAAGGEAVAEEAAPTAGKPAVPTSDAALRLLALLQQEGRLVDFLLEDIGPYDDSQVGAAVRSIHAGCRSVLEERVQLERILEGEDGAVVEVPAGFDAAAIRVTGNVAGTPPFRGTLQHSGWRAVKIALPDSSTDPRVVAPAEVEVP